VSSRRTQHPGKLRIIKRIAVARAQHSQVLCSRVAKEALNVSTGVFAENEVYDPGKDSWQSLEPMLTPRHGTGGASLGGIFYVPGGATRQGYGAVDTNESYTP